MRKLLIPLLLSIFLIVGCENTMNTPSEKVTQFLEKYQRMDTAVIQDLDSVMNHDTTMSKTQKEEYKSLLEKQYQNLAFKITDENVEDDVATVDVEIEVLDYKNAIKRAEEYYRNHPEEFQEEKDKDDDTDGLLEDGLEMINDVKDYLEYKIMEMKSVTDKIKYSITFHLIKEDGIWKIEDLSEDDLQKIHGLY